MTNRDDDLVTIRDIYSLVQQLNERSVTLVEQVGTLAERAAEDRAKVLNLATDIQKLKIKVYSAGAALVLLSGVVMFMDRLSSLSGGGA